jgi:hypothetical protein
MKTMSRIFKTRKDNELSNSNVTLNYCAWQKLLAGGASVKWLTARTLEVTLDLRRKEKTN